MPSTIPKTTTGFDLLIGKYLNTGYFRAEEPTQTLSPCPKCSCPAREVWHLKQFIFAFGKVITKHKKFYTCQNCFHEAELSVTWEKPKAKSAKNQLLEAFKSLTPEQQKNLLERKNS